jgi:hypothetical protein
VRGKFNISERRACRVLKQHRSTHRYVPKSRDECLNEHLFDTLRHARRM